VATRPQFRLDFFDPLSPQLRFSEVIYEISNRGLLLALLWHAMTIHKHMKTKSVNNIILLMSCYGKWIAYFSIAVEVRRNCLRLCEVFFRLEGVTLNHSTPSRKRNSERERGGFSWSEQEY
jgi:hypothetical protein